MVRVLAGWPIASIATASLLVVSPIGVSSVGISSAMAENPADAADAEITYDQVLADPDDIALNYRFALSQIRRGDLLGALATLDRLILLAPAEPDIRALRAIVLYRLDNLNEAEGEISDLLALDLDEDLRLSLERYAGELDRRTAPWRFDLLTSFGYQFDSNRAGTPNGNRVRTILGVSDLAEGSRQEDDHALTGLIRFGFEHDFPGQDQRTLFGFIGLYDSDQFALDEFDTLDANAELGARLELGEVLLTPRFSFDHLRLGDAAYLEAYSGDLRFDWRIDDPVNLWGKIGLGHLDYTNSGRLPVNDLQTGTDVSLALGTDLFLDSDHRLTLGFTHHVFASDTDWENATGERLAATHTWLLGRGLFLLTDLSLAYDDYSDPDPLIGPKKRADFAYRARSTLGIPLGIPLRAIAGSGALPDALDDLTLALFGEYYRADSNIINYDFDNIRVGATISKRWEF